MTDIMTPEEVADELCVTPKAARSLIRLMPHYRFSSRTVRVRRPVLQHWKREQLVLLHTTGTSAAPVTWPHTIPPTGAWPARATVGYAGVYVIQAGDDGAFKIGVSNDVAARVATLQTASPHELRFLGLIGADATDEAAHHEALQTQRVRGEWFANSLYTRLYLAPLLGVDGGR